MEGESFGMGRKKRGGFLHLGCATHLPAQELWSAEHCVSYHIDPGIVQKPATLPRPDTMSSLSRPGTKNDRRNSRGTLRKG